MAWYKIAQDFTKRNSINHKIHYLTSLKQDLTRLAKLVFQSGRLTKEATTLHIYDKRMSSYPDLKDRIIHADQMVYDSPWQFSALCTDTVEVIEGMVTRLERERNNMFRKKTRQKGWFI